MQDEPIYLTKEGLENLKKELKELKEVRMPEVSKEIQTARDFGDISENVAYDTAKQEQARVEGKISELEDILKHAKVKNNTEDTSIVDIGSTVTVHIDGNEMQLQIVGAVEADPTKRKISHESPIGAALLGKKVGEKVTISAPIGEAIYTITSIN